MVLLPKFNMSVCFWVMISPVFISKKSMLEWVTFSQTQSQVTTNFGLKEIMTSGPLFAGMTTLLLVSLKPTSLFIAAPFIIAWASAPFISRVTRKRSRPRRLALEENEIGEAIIKVLSDENLAKQMSEDGWNYVQQFRPEVCSQNIHRIYSSLIK